MGPSGIQLLVVAVIVLLLFGGKKIPELAKGLGSGIKNFKKALKDDDEELTTANSSQIEKKTEDEVKDTKDSEIKQS